MFLKITFHIWTAIIKVNSLYLAFFFNLNLIFDFTYKGLRQLSNASFDELASEIGPIDADKIIKFFNS